MCFFYIMGMYEFLREFRCTTCVLCPWRPEGPVSSGTRVTGVCRPLPVSARNLTWVSAREAHALHCRATSPVLKAVPLKGSTASQHRTRDQASSSPISGGETRSKPRRWLFTNACLGELEQNPGQTAFTGSFLGSTMLQRRTYPWKRNGGERITQ